MTNILVRVSWTVTEILCTLLEIVFSLFLTALVGPTLLIIWLLNLLVRSIIQLIFYINNASSSSPRIQLLPDGADGIWSFRKYGNSRNILIVYVYAHPISLAKQQFNYENLVINFVAENGSKPYQKLKNIFTKRFGYYCWKEATDFNIKNHVKNIFSEAEVISESQLRAFLPSLTGDMDETKPQWEELIIPRFRYDNEEESKMIEKSARIYRSHHAFMDGCSNLLMTGTCMGDVEKFPYIIDPLAPLRVPGWKIFIYQATCVLMGAKTVMKNLYEASQLRSPFLMEKYSGHQLFSWSEPIPMKILREIKAATKTSIPSIFSSVSAKALNTLEETGMHNNRKIHTKDSKGMSIGLVGAVIPYLGISPKNRFTVVNFQVQTLSTVKRIERLKRTHQEFLRLTRKPDGLVNYKMFQIFGKFPDFVIQFLMRKAGTPVIYSNTPWATKKVTLWGDEVKDVIGWMPLLTTAGVGLLTVSYGDSFRFCVIADQSCLSQNDLNSLMDEINNEIQLLHKESKDIDLTGQSTHRNGIFSV